MSLYMLDTDTVSHALRGAPSVDARLSQLDPSAWCISAITRAELRYGLALRPDATRLATLVEAFLECARCLPWDADAADRHGPVRARLKELGQPIGPFDEQIAAHALAVGAVLVTGNLRHMARVPELRVVSWLDP